MKPKIFLDQKTFSRLWNILVDFASLRQNVHNTNVCEELDDVKDLVVTSVFENYHLQQYEVLHVDIGARGGIVADVRNRSTNQIEVVQVVCDDSLSSPED